MRHTDSVDPESEGEGNYMQDLHTMQKHTIFGRVYSGMSTVQRLGNIQTGAGYLHLIALDYTNPIQLLHCVD